MSKKICGLSMMILLIGMGSLASAFSFSDLFSFFGISAQESGQDDSAHHTVWLASPANNSYTSQNNSTLQFVYNHTGSLSGTVNCTLFIDGAAVNYTAGVAPDTNTAAYSNSTIAEGQRFWWVNCSNGTDTDSSLDAGYNYTFTSDYTNPTEPTLISP